MKAKVTKQNEEDCCFKKIIRCLYLKFQSFLSNDVMHVSTPNWNLLLNYPETPNLLCITLSGYKKVVFTGRNLFLQVVFNSKTSRFIVTRPVFFSKIEILKNVLTGRDLYSQRFRLLFSKVMIFVFADRDSFFKGRKTYWLKYLFPIKH